MNTFASLGDVNIKLEVRGGRWSASLLYVLVLLRAELQEGTCVKIMLEQQEAGKTNSLDFGVQQIIAHTTRVRMDFILFLVSYLQ